MVYKSNGETWNQLPAQQLLGEKEREERTHHWANYQSSLHAGDFAFVQWLHRSLSFSPSHSGNNLHSELIAAWVSEWGCVHVNDVLPLTRVRSDYAQPFGSRHRSFTNPTWFRVISEFNPFLNNLTSLCTSDWWRSQRSGSECIELSAFTLLRMPRAICCFSMACRLILFPSFLPFCRLIRHHIFLRLLRHAADMECWYVLLTFTELMYKPF